MEKRIAPYIKRQHKEQAARVRANERNRVQRYRSSLFTRPECTDLPDCVVVTPGHFDPSMENIAMAINRRAVSLQAKVIILFPEPELADQLNSAEVFNVIATSEWNVGVVLGSRETLGVALSMDMFLLARGLDELIENPSEAIADLILRLDLLGVNIQGKEIVGSLRSVNVDKGELLVNFGSPNFSDVHSEGN